MSKTFENLIFKLEQDKSRVKAELIQKTIETEHLQKSTYDRVSLIEYVMDYIKEVKVEMENKVVVERSTNKEHLDNLELIRLKKENAALVDLNNDTIASYEANLMAKDKVVDSLVARNRALVDEVTDQAICLGQSISTIEALKAQASLAPESDIACAERLAVEDEFVQVVNARNNLAIQVEELQAKLAETLEITQGGRTNKDLAKRVAKQKMYINDLEANQKKMSKDIAGVIASRNNLQATRDQLLRRITRLEEQLTKEQKLKQKAIEVRDNRKEAALKLQVKITALKKENEKLSYKQERMNI